MSLHATEGEEFSTRFDCVHGESDFHSTRGESLCRHLLQKEESLLGILSSPLNQQFSDRGPFATGGAKATSRDILRGPDLGRRAAASGGQNRRSPHAGDGASAKDARRARFS